MDINIIHVDFRLEGELATIIKRLAEERGVSAKELVEELLWEGVRELEPTAGEQKE
jgi:hypothetical protein